MGRNGWSYLVVEHGGAGASAATRPYFTRDGDGFTTESEMFRELGACGWELVAIRDEEGGIRYYFKRPRT